MGEIGDGWMLLIIWASLNDVTRFDEFQEKLGVARNILSDRLKRLVDSGLLDKRPVRPGSRRCEYVPTAKSEPLREPLSSMRAWGETWCPMREETPAEAPARGRPAYANRAMSA